MVASPSVQRQVNLAYSQQQLRSQNIQGMQQRQIEQQQAISVQQQEAQKVQQVQAPQVSEQLYSVGGHTVTQADIDLAEKVIRSDNPNAIFMLQGHKGAREVYQVIKQGQREDITQIKTELPSYISPNVQKVIRETGATSTGINYNIRLLPTSNTINKEGIVLPYQERGTQVYKPETGYVTPRTYIVGEGKPQTILQDIKAVSNLPYVIGSAAQEQIEQRFFPYVIKEKKVELPLLPYQVRGTLISSDSEFNLPKGENIIIPEQRTSIGKEYGIGKVIGYGTPLAAYMLPVAGNIFLTASGVSGTATALDTKATKQERILGGIEAGVAFSILGGQAYSTLTKPTSTYIKQPVESTFVEVQKPTTEGVLSKYTITQRVPPVIKVTNTPIGRLFNRPPLISAATEEQFFITKTKGWSKLDKPFTVVSGKYGSDKVTFTKVIGDAIPYEKETFNQLPKSEQYLWQKIAEKQTGIPVSLKNVPNILSKNIDKIRGQVYTKDLFAITPKSANKVRVDVNTLGKTEAQFTTATISREIPSENFYSLDNLGGTKGSIGVTPEARIVQSTTLFKETTKPFARASGKVPELKGFTFILPEEEKTAGSFLTGTAGRKSSQEYVQSLYQLPKVAPKIISPKLPNVKPVLETTTETITSILGKTTPVIVTGMETQLKQAEQVKLQTGIREIGLEKAAEKTTELVKVAPKVTSFEKVVSKVAQPTKTAVIEIPQLKPDQQQKEQLKQSNRIATIQVSPTMFPIPVPKLIPKIKIPSETFIKEKEPVRIFKRAAYNVLIKRKGKFLEIGKNLPRGKALALGEKIAKTTLARTFALKPSGTTELQDISFNVSPREFRLPKRPTGIKESYVQIKALTRGTGEVKEIQMFKRAKSKRFKLFK